MRVFAGLTMQKTNYSPGSSVTVMEYRFDVLDFPNEQNVSRESVFMKMMDKMPGAVRDGAVMFFTAESDPMLTASDTSEQHGLPAGGPRGSRKPDHASFDMILARAMPIPAKIRVHMANEHGIDPDLVLSSQQYRHLEAHMYGQFRADNEHYHT